MIRTEQGYAQIFKIYGKSETEVKEKLQKEGVDTAGKKVRLVVEP